MEIQLKTENAAYSLRSEAFVLRYLRVDRATVGMGLNKMKTKVRSRTQKAKVHLYQQDILQALLLQVQHCPQNLTGSVSHLYGNIYILRVGLDSDCKHLEKRADGVCCDMFCKLGSGCPGAH